MTDETAANWPARRVIEVYPVAPAHLGQREALEQLILRLGFTAEISRLRQLTVQAMFLEQIRRTNGNGDLDELGLSAPVDDFPFGFMVLVRPGTDVERATSWFDALPQVGLARRALPGRDRQFGKPGNDRAVDVARFMELCENFGDHITWTSRVEVWMADSATVDDVEGVVEAIRDTLEVAMIDYWYLGANADEVARRFDGVADVTTYEMQREEYEVVVFEVETRGDLGPHLFEVEESDGVEFLNAPFIGCYAAPDDALEDFADFDTDVVA